MSLTKDIGLSALAVVFPPVCLKCGRVEGRRSTPLCLCKACRGRLRPVSRLNCVHCRQLMMPIGFCGGYRCHHCRGGDGKIHRQLSLWRYESPLDAVIHGLKFKKMEFLGFQLAAALHSKFSAELSEINVVVPIPLHWYRRLGRGYNQAEAIGLPFAKMLGTPMVRGLRRKRPTRAQARLERTERLGNLGAALVPTSTGIRELGRSRVLLVDDVMTTGATLSAATRSLDLCGVRSVTTVTVASTPLGASQKKSQMAANAEDREFRGL